MNDDTLVAEEAYAESLSEPLEKANSIGEADIVVGISFQNETDTIGHVCQTVAKGFSEFFPDEKCVVVCVGAVEGEDALNVIQEVRLGRAIKRIAFLMKNKRVSGKVWRIRAIMEIAEILNADLAVFEADLKSRKLKAGIDGLAPEWVNRLLFPIKKEGIDLVIPRFNRHYFDAQASTHLVRPLLASIFNLKVGDLPGCVLGVSSKLLRTYVADANIWSDQVGEYGVDSWLITTAIISEAKICETSFGGQIRRSYPDKETMWRQHTKAIFEQIAAAKEWWQQKGDIIYPLGIFGEKRNHWPDEVAPDPIALIERYRQGFNEFQGLYEEILSREVLIELRKLAGSDPDTFRFPSNLWAEIVYDFLLSYSLELESTKSNILSAFIPMCYAREAGFAQEIGTPKKRLLAAIPDDGERLTSLVAQWEVDQQTEEFIKHKPGFLEKWMEKEKALKPLLPKVTYREFIPGVPLIVLKEFVSPADEIVSTDGIYNSILQRYRKEFEEFVHEKLEVPREATSAEIAQSIEELMLQLEKDIDKLLLTGDLSTVDGTRRVAEAIFQNFPHSETFALKPEVASWILQRNPPSNLLIRFGASSLAELEDRYGPNDILALSSISEDTEHTVRVWEWIAGNARPEHFTHFSVEPLVMSCEHFPMLVDIREPSTLSKLAGRIIVSNLRRAAGGEFPKIRYFVHMAKNIVEAERFGEVWKQFARERKEFGTRVINSLKGHWGGDPLSAHNMFENKIQRILIDRLRKMTEDLARNGNSSLVRLTRSLSYMADSYHLALSLPDKFIPCSAWTWASYSFRGGKGLPTPLSLHVERDWASREFLVELHKALGGSEKDVDSEVIELMGQGMESENLARLVLPGWESVQEVLPTQLPRLAEPEAGKLTRFAANPILGAIAEHDWESKYVFNPGVIRLKGRIYILYRACGEDEISRIGLATSSDGLHIEERLGSPIFGPEEDWEKRGCEDPRLVLLDERIYMLYTGYDSVTAQIALASISLDDFLNHRWNKWKRQGLVFPGFEDKDATLFPQMFNGRYVMYHRIEPSIWISSSEHLDCPWPREDHRILVGPGAGMAWDGFKIGGGSQPIKTKYGWLLIYHGVAHSWVYRLGVLLMRLDDPGRLLYRSPNPILEPEEGCELGDEGCYVPNVVFTCGAVPSVDREILEDDDEVLVYYGAADTVICVATAKVSDLIPKEIRQSRNHNGYWT